MKGSTTYSLAEVEELLGLTPAEIRGLVTAGFVAPVATARQGMLFSFQDVVVLRTAAQLRKDQIPRRQMLRSLESLRARLAPGRPMSALRIRAFGREVAVRAGDGWQTADDQQLLLDLEGAAVPATPEVAHIAPAAIEAAPADPAELVKRGLSLEETDAQAAEQAYRSALEADPTHADALINLGALLCHHGRCHEAVELYDVAVRVLPDASGLHFNHAIALEDQGRFASAAASYERALQIEPELADAHFNAARLYERLGDAQRALRHYSAYRRSQG